MSRVKRSLLSSAEATERHIDTVRNLQKVLRSIRGEIEAMSPEASLEDVLKFKSRVLALLEDQILIGNSFLNGLKSLVEDCETLAGAIPDSDPAPSGSSPTA